jgi:hypothetical protein
LPAHRHPITSVFDAIPAYGVEKEVVWKVVDWKVEKYIDWKYCKSRTIFVGNISKWSAIPAYGVEKSSCLEGSLERQEIY